MSNVTHATAARNSIAEHVLDLLDTGSTNAAGQIVVLTAGDAELVTLALSNPSITGSASGGTATFDSITNGSATGTGTADKVEFQDCDEAIVFEGLAGVRVAIGAVSTGSSEFTIPGNFQGDSTLAADELIRVTGSTGNDGTYTVVSATDDGANTDIVVEETVSNATADGTLHTGAVSFDNRSIASGQTVSASSAAYTAPA